MHLLRFRRDHRWAPPHMSAYVDDDLPLRARTRLERHVEECPECRGVLKSLRRMLGLLGGLGPGSTRPDVPDIAGAVRARLRE